MISQNIFENKNNSSNKKINFRHWNFHFWNQKQIKIKKILFKHWQTDCITKAKEGKQISQMLAARKKHVKITFQQLKDIKLKMKSNLQDSHKGNILLCTNH